MIKLEGVSKVYGKRDAEFRALDDINLEVSKGSIVAIVGKSGSGKSTLMHLMSGLDSPTTGLVRVGENDLSKMRQHRVDTFRASSVGFIFQSFFVEPKQTCYQNVALPLEIKGVPYVKRRKLVGDALESVGLSDKTNEQAGNLSGGQKQRLAIARAIVNKPEYIFADEPTGNLDSVNGEKIIKLLFSLNEYIGSTLIFVTHDQELAKKCQVQITLKDGKVEHVKEQKPKKDKK
jgi:putative ABC transport system ATP-binding protein